MGAEAASWLIQAAGLTAVSRIAGSLRGLNFFLLRWVLKLNLAEFGSWIAVCVVPFHGSS
jgi:hypothetical protein